MRSGWSFFAALALPMGLFLLWAVRDAPLEPAQRAFLLAATIGTAALSAWVLTLLE